MFSSRRALLLCEAVCRLKLKPVGIFCRYNMVTNNVAELSAVQWDYVVADEVRAYYITTDFLC